MLNVLQDVKKVIHHTPLVVDSPLAHKYLNEGTVWGDHPGQYFGIGGGSQYLTCGFPLDVVGMLMAGEILRRELKLHRCSVLLADIITKTNPFPEDQINRALRGEAAMMSHIIGLLGLSNWEVVLHSDLHAVNDGGEVDKNNISRVDPENCRHPGYVRTLKVMNQFIDQGIAASPFAILGRSARGHKDNWHFALETALTEYLVGNGVHLGWLIPSADIRTHADVARLIEAFGQTGIKRMDEEPFDSYHHHTVRLAIEAGVYPGPNRVSAIYVQAGVKLPPDSNLKLVQRVPPYITYNPATRLLLSDTVDDVRRKTTRDGVWKFPSRGALSGFWKKFVRLAALLDYPVGLANEDLDLSQRLGGFLEFLQAGGQLRQIYAETFPEEEVRARMVVN